MQTTARPRSSRQVQAAASGVRAHMPCPALITRLGLAAAGLAAVTSLAACSGTTSTASAGIASANSAAASLSSAFAAATATTGSSGSGASPTSSGMATTGTLGDTLDTASLAEDPLAVTLKAVADPATPSDPDNGADAGTRWVGLTFTVVVNGPDADTGMTFVVGSDGKDYGLNAQSFDFNGCTDTSGSETQGEPITTCAGAMVPTGVQVAKVAFSGLGTESGAGVLFWTLG